MFHPSLKGKWCGLRWGWCYCVSLGLRLIPSLYLMLLGLVLWRQFRGFELGLNSSGQESCALWPLALSLIVLLLLPATVHQSRARSLLYSSPSLAHQKWWVGWTVSPVDLIFGNFFFYSKTYFGYMITASKKLPPIH